ncbi:MAG TPA: cytochrome c oxidase assembly protein [Candidatus Bathyarchaeia archaeon]|nr:cytochrome c oxidase assembly protein [Candidatus Bathyarchaeia archaeon]
MPVQWWCSATGKAWTWTWQPYPGVWILVATLAVPAMAGRRTGLVASQRARWSLGTALFWASLDWPLGTMGAGYLLSAHTLQFLLIAYAAVPIVLTGVPTAWIDPIEARPAVVSWLRRVTHPIVAILAFAAVVVVSHVPAVVDALRPTQLGSFGLDMAWVLAGGLLWWPVIVQRPAFLWFAPPLRILYLFLSGISCIGIGIVLALTDLPLYRLYELAPRIEALPVRFDQQIAAMLMWVVAHLMTLAAITIVFFEWVRGDERDSAETAAVDWPLAQRGEDE